MQTAKYMLGALCVYVIWMASNFLINGYWHQNNNYGIKPADYSIRTISASKFSQLTSEQQLYWAQDGNSDTYLTVTIKRPFVWWHARNGLLTASSSAIALMLGVAGAAIWSERKESATESN